MIVFVDRMVYTVSVCQCHDTLNTGIVAFIPDVIVIMFVMIEVWYCLNLWIKPSDLHVPAYMCPVSINSL
jgi:hypothetical protein